MELAPSDATTSPARLRAVLDLAAGEAPWKAHVACRGMSIDIFFPEHGQQNADAKTVCDACAVQAECLDAALGRPERHGIWGGTTERERRKLRPDAA